MIAKAQEELSHFQVNNKPRDSQLIVYVTAEFGWPLLSRSL